MAEQQARTGAVWKRLLGGFLIGIAFLVPGTSGAALAATLGYFEPAIAALSRLLKTPKQSIAYLLPLAAGGIVGAAVVAIALVRVLDVAESQAISFFMGMVAGSLPMMWRASHQGRVRPWQVLLMVAGFAVTMGLLYMEITAADPAHVAEVTLPIALGSGAILGAGAVVPGISGSFFVIYLGWYRPLIHAMLALNIPVIAMTALGFIAACLLLVKGADWLFQNRREGTYCVILGFVTGSLILVAPNDFLGSLWWLNLLLAAAGLVAGLALSRLEKVE